MKSIILLALATLSFFQIGLLVDFYLLRKKKIVFNPAKFLGLGIGFLGLLQLLLSVLKIFLSQSLVFIFYLLLSLPFIIDQSLVSQIKMAYKKGVKKISIIPLTLFSILLLIIIIQTFSHTIWGSDAYSYWLFKAKAYFIDGLITQKNLVPFWAHDHPLLWSVTATWVYHFLGEASEYWFQAIPLIIWINLIFVFYLYLPVKSFSQKIGLTSILALTPFLLENVTSAEYAGNADLLVSFYFLLAIIYLFKKQLTYSGLFLFFASFTKSDALPGVVVFWGLLVLGMIFLSRKTKLFLKPFLSLSILLVFHWFWKNSFGLKNRYLVNFLAESRPLGKYMWYTAHAFREEFRQLAHWGLGWWLSLFLVVINLKELSKNKFLLGGFLIIIAQFLGYFLAYYLTPENPASQIATSIFRLVLQMYPATLFLASWMHYNKKSYANRN